jgi:hypothetical protein
MLINRKSALASEITGDIGKAEQFTHDVRVPQEGHGKIGKTLKHESNQVEFHLRASF